MPGENVTRWGFVPEIRGENEVKQTWSDLLDLLKKKASEVWDATGEEAGKALGEGLTAVGKTYDELGKSFKKTTTDAFKGTISSIFQGEMDKVEDIWHNAWDNMTTAAEKHIKRRQSNRVKFLLYYPRLLVSYVNYEL